MTRRERQRTELIALCRNGPPARAIDLAVGHLAEFGPDDDLLARMRDALDERDLGEAAWQRFRELCPAAAEPDVPVI